MAQSVRTITIEQEYEATHTKSAALYREACEAMPSGLVHDGRMIRPFPFYVTHADRAYKWDVDGNQYIDCWSGHGALVLGHNPPAVTQAIEEQLHKGLHYSGCHELELKWASLVRKMVPCAELVRFTMTGTETTQLAMRVARTFTGREKIVKFVAHFHGIHDYAAAAVRVPYDVPVSAGVPKATLSSVIVLEQHDLEGLKRVLANQDVAAVILEPAGSHSAVMPLDPAVLRGMREATRETGTLFIFDETVTGFRLAAGGAQEYFGVVPDLACLAKAISGGLPGAALAGSKDVMSVIAFTGDPVRDRNQRVADQGTHSGAPLLAAAGVANLTELSTGEAQRRINAQGDELTARLNESFRQRGIKGCGYNVGSIVRFHVGDTAEELGLPYPTDSRLDKPHGELGKKIVLAMLLEGVHVGGDSKSFLNAAMTDDDIREIARAYDRTLERLDAEGAI